MQYKFEYTKSEQEKTAVQWLDIHSSSTLCQIVISLYPPVLLAITRDAVLVLDDGACSHCKIDYI